MKTGIYFLLSHGEIVYIGKTTKFPERLWQHKTQRLEYDSVRFIECERNLLADYEARWILRFLPKYNQSLKKRKVSRKDAPVPVNDKKIKIYRNMKFRKLTEKSFLGFGRFRDTTVSDCLLRGKKVELVSIYFNMSHITFFDNILDDLKITPEWRIQKPGVDKEKGYELIRLAYPEEIILRKKRSDKRLHSMSLSKIENMDRVSNNKSWLMNKNRTRH